jgi:hypothetical protein
MAFTEEDRTRKWYNLREQGELAWWQAFESRTGIPSMNMFKILAIRAADVRALSQAERDQLQQARAVADRLRDKILYLDSLTLDQQAEFDALTWSSTP